MNSRLGKHSANQDLRFLAQLRSVGGNPRILVLTTHGFLELLVNAVIDTKCKNGKKKITSNNRDFPHSTKLLILNELGLLPDGFYRILDWFRRIRNRAAHEPFFELTRTELDLMKKYRGEFQLGEFTPGDTELERFCGLIVASFWNAHTRVLAPLFSLSATRKEKAGGRPKEST